MRPYLLVLLVMVLVLAGGLLVLNQSGSDDEELEVSQEATSTPEPTVEAPPTDEGNSGVWASSSPAPPVPEIENTTAPIPLPGQGGASFDDMQPNTVEIDITGDYTASGSVESFEYIPETTGLFAPRQIIMRVDVESADEPPGRLDLFLMVPDEPPGSYPLVDTLREMSDSWSVIHSIFGRESWISPDEMDGVDIGGTIEVVERWGLPQRSERRISLPDPKTKRAKRLPNRVAQ